METEKQQELHIACEIAKGRAGKYRLSETEGLDQFRENVDESDLEALLAYKVDMLRVLSRNNYWGLLDEMGRAMDRRDENAIEAIEEKLEAIHDEAQSLPAPDHHPKK